MKVYDKINSMNQTEMARFIADLLYGSNSSGLIGSFDDSLCSDCTSAGSIVCKEIHECDYQAGNCNDLCRVEKWLESEVNEDD